MKKFLSLMLALMLTLSVASGLAEALAVENTGLPQAGDVVNGFEALEIRPFPLVGADVVLFEHQKTGAKVLYVANDSKNRVFQLTFATRPIDNTGLPHVFEHATLSGSEKYPSAALFMNLLNQTYNTYMNAYTTDAMTCYPIASLSEAQLLKYADYYTDSCLHPRVMEQESTFKTEAWRYRMESMEDDLTLEGTVYSEMLGAYTLARAALLNANQITFPGAALGLDYGGHPDYIPEMTWDALKAYHEKFYHPSNCLALLYGDFEDYTAFLALLDEAFAPYEKASFHYEDVDYAPITGPVESVLPYPTAAGSDTNNQSYVYFYIVCPGMKGDTQQEAIIDNAMTLLSQSSSVLMQNLKKALPAGSFSFGREVAAPDDAIVFVAANVNKDDGPLFKEIVLSSLAQAAQEGFPQDMVDAANVSLGISTKLAPENGSPVEGVLQSLAYNYVTTGNPFHYLDQVESLNQLEAWNQQGLYQAAIEKWLLNKDTWTLTTTYPAPGMKEEHDEALAQYLALLKEQMTDEEKQAIIDETNAEAEPDDASALVAQLQAVTLESLPEEVKTYPINDVTGEDGVRRLDVIAGVDGIGQVSLMLDASALPQEDLHWFRLFTRLLGKMDTDAHTWEELTVLTSRYLYSQLIGINSLRTAQKELHPYFELDWIAMDEDLQAGYDLMEELVFHTQFTDTQRLLEQVQNQKASVRSAINSSAYSIALYRMAAIDSPALRYYSYINYLEYYDFLNKAEQLLTEAPEKAVESLERVQAFFNNRQGAVAAFAGNEHSIAVNRPLADAFLAKLSDEKREKVEYNLPVPSEHEAVIIDSNVQFNVMFASLEDLGVEDLDVSLNVVSTLVQDQFLIPLLRDQYGVYTPFAGILNEAGLYLITYRDPNVTETYQVYASLPELIAQMETDQDTLNGFILSNYSSLAQGSGELTGAADVISTVVAGYPQDRALEYMRQYKATTPETVRASAEIFAKMMENGSRSTFGSAAAINANADFFDSILNPFNAKDTSQVVFNDAQEGSEHYEAIRFMYENGLMQPLADDLFGAEETAPAGDLYGFLYALLGGEPNAAEEAMATLGQYSLVPEGFEPATPLDKETTVAVLSSFCRLAQLEWTPEDPGEAGAEPLTRGELAQWLFNMYSSLQ